MTGFVDRLKLKEQAEEDIYFARRDRELLGALQRHQEGDGAIEVVSGGQTGVDRAALDAALELGLTVRGWCPRGRRAEDGPIANAYPLTETPSRDYAERTEWNVRDSDATLILYRGSLTGGTRLTADLARRLGRPLCARDLPLRSDPDAILSWLLTNRIRSLNCAGPRESGAPGIQGEAFVLLRGLFARWIERRAEVSLPASSRP
ncbi:putative molybdenum carrier protein [Thiorhodococcus fuscus]|uniref:Molybdenum carrier protein n=1 Tax=Thiorhodococcus fuscus TaxID=527200 RepID=A0ABW4YCD3_9GAMM